VSGPSPTRLWPWRLVVPRGRERVAAVAALGAGALSQLAGLGLLASAGWLIAEAALRPPILTLTIAIAAVRLFALTRPAARYGEQLAVHDAALRALGRIRVWAFAALEPNVPSWRPKLRDGDVLDRVVADVDGLQDLYVRLALPLGEALVVLAAAGAAASLLDLRAGVVLLGGVAIGAAAGPGALAVADARSGARLAAARGRRDEVLVEAVEGAEELRALGGSGAAIGAVAEATGELWACRRHQAWRQALGQALATGLPGLLAVAVCVAGLPALASGALSGVEAATVAFLALAAGDAVSGLPDVASRLGATRAGLRRVAALALAPDDREEPRGPDSTPARPAEAAGPAEPGPAEPGPAPFVAGAWAREALVRLEDVTVGEADGGPAALRDVELSVEEGARLAVVGPSGSGKTTLAHVILGFVVPTRGRVYVEGAQLSAPGADTWRSRVAWAPQRAHVFRASLATNLRLARPEASDAELLEALAAVGLDRLVAALPRGLDTVLESGEASLSAGEQQRVALARVLLADRPVVVLDEPTSHLDARLAARVRRELLGRLAGRTVVWVTHAPEEARALDSVVVLRGGRLDASGAPAGRRVG